MTQGDRATNLMFIQDDYHIHDKYGKRSVEHIISVGIGDTESKVKFYQQYETAFSKEELRKALVLIGIITPGNEIKLKNRTPPKFMNRLLGLPLEMQSKFLSYYKNVVQYFVQEDVQSDAYDTGIKGNKTLTK